MSYVEKEFDPTIPPFLLRPAPKKKRRATRQAKPRWKMPTGDMKRLREKRDATVLKEDTRPRVLRAIRDGADTFGKIRKAVPDTPDTILRSAIRYQLKLHAIRQEGKRYRRGK